MQCLNHSWLFYHVMHSFSALQLFTLRGHLAVYAAVYPVFLIDKLKPVGQTLLMEVMHLGFCILRYFPRIRIEGSFLYYDAVIDY